MKIDGIRSFVDKHGLTRYEVLSIYETPKASGIWALSGRWIGVDEPSLDQPVRYIQGKYGFVAFPDHFSDHS